jgi:hypothetical protein
LPPGSGSELPQLPAIPWTDNDGSLANRLFGALFGPNYALQTQAAWPDSILWGRGAVSGSAASTLTTTTTLALPD